MNLETYEVLRQPFLAAIVKEDSDVGTIVTNLVEAASTAFRVDHPNAGVQSRFLRNVHGLANMALCDEQLSKDAVAALHTMAKQAITRSQSPAAFAA